MALVPFGISELTPEIINDNNARSRLVKLIGFAFDIILYTISLLTFFFRKSLQKHISRYLCSPQTHIKSPHCLLRCEYL